MDDLKDVFAHELQDLYRAENQLVEALPKMAKSTTSDELRMAFKSHLKETQTHVLRLEQVAQLCEMKLHGHKCKGIEGLLEEGSELLRKEDKNVARDAALISAAQRIEHYEMAAYGSAVAFANLLGRGKAEALLQKTLNEEIAAQAMLTKIARQKVNPDAMRATGEMSKKEKARNGKTPAMTVVSKNGHGSTTQTTKTSKASSTHKS